MNVLLVEDDDGVREVMTDLLTDSATVRATNSVPEALEALSTESFQLVIADLRIRGMSEGGMQVLSAARQSLVPVLLMTGLQREELRRVLGDQRPDAMLLKPFPIEEALALYQGFVRLYREAAALVQQVGVLEWKPLGPGLHVHGVQEGMHSSKQLVSVEAGVTGVAHRFAQGQVGQVGAGEVLIDGVALTAGQPFFLATEKPHVFASVSGGWVALVSVTEQE